MALAKRSAAYYNGLDKKHDGDGTNHGQSWQPNTRMRSWMTIRKRRIFLAIVVVGLIYLFFTNMPTDVPSAGNRIDPLTGLSRARMPKQIQPGRQPDALDTVVKGNTYDGPVKFYQLAITLRDHARKAYDGKENVVFVLHDLRSAASLIALACEMGLHNRTNVHMLLLCPQDNTIEEIFELTGIKQQECPIYWHDARPDHNSQSSVTRRATAIQSALGNVYSYIKPAVVIIDEQQARHTQLTVAMKARLDQLWIPLTILPDIALTSMRWITALDARGLSLVNQNQIDIIITPYRSSSGSLIRLLRSIQAAHYVGLPFPRITVEIPPDVDSFALQYLESFRWPFDVPTSPSKLILRKRLHRKTSSPLSASIQTLESFYPPSYPMSHVLLLDPDVELLPDYLSSLHYLTMEYKYSSKGQNITSALMGVSLEMATTSSQEDLKDSHFILSQKPTSAATLYFGDKWVELQNYLSLRLQHDPDLTKKISENTNTESLPSTERPAWLAPAAELMRARNYYMLHPTFSSDPIARLMFRHAESHQAPEEYPLPEPEITDEKYNRIPPPVLDATTVLANDPYPPPYPPPSKYHLSPDLSLFYLSLLLKSTGQAGLPPDTFIPLLDHSGRRTDWAQSTVKSSQYAEQVSLQLGGCKNVDDRDASKQGVENLFCGGAE